MHFGSIWRCVHVFQISLDRFSRNVEHRKETELNLEWARFSFVALSLFWRCLVDEPMMLKV